MAVRRPDDTLNLSHSAARNLALCWCRHRFHRARGPESVCCHRRRAEVAVGKFPRPNEHFTSARSVHERGSRKSTDFLPGTDAGGRHSDCPFSVIARVAMTHHRVGGQVRLRLSRSHLEFSPSSPTAPENRLLGLLPPAVLARLTPHLESVHLRRKDVLFRANETLRVCYFPSTAVVSLVSTLESGDSLEVGIVGRDGLAGTSVFPGIFTMSCDGIVQFPGVAHRISTDVLRAEGTRERGALLDPWPIRTGPPRTQHADVGLQHVPSRRAAVHPVAADRERLDRQRRPPADTRPDGDDARGAPPDGDLGPPLAGQGRPRERIARTHRHPGSSPPRAILLRMLSLDAQRAASAAGLLTIALCENRRFGHPAYRLTWEVASGCTGNPLSI